MGDSKIIFSQDLISKFSRFLDEQIGLYYPKERWNDLQKKMLSIMNSFGFDSPAAWIEYLDQHPLDSQKMAILTHYLTVGETYFFREPKTFEVLEKQIIPTILQIRQKEKNIRIWCAACCTGEEPYSIAIVLHRLIPNIGEWNISILGTDINLAFLRKAEQASYKKWSFRATPPTILNKYFTKESGDTYVLSPAIRKLVEFSYLNLVEGPYPSCLSDMDLVLCHNVLIYFSKDQIKKVLAQVVKTIRHHGWLSVGAVEVPFIREDQLRYQNFNGAVFFQKGYQLLSEYHLLTPFNTASQFKVTPEKNKTSFPSIIKKELIEQQCKYDREELYKKCLDLSEKKEYTEVVVHLSAYLAELPSLSQHLKEVILLIRTYANLGEMAQAIDWCGKAIKANKLDPTLYYLKATIEEARGEFPKAVQSLKNALFLDPEFIMAHYILGIIEKRQRNHQAAERHFKSALALIDRFSGGEVLPGTDEITIESLRGCLQAHLAQEI